MGRAWVPEAKEVQDLTICWQGDGQSILDAKGVIMLDFLPKRSTITGVYNANLLDQLRTTIREKWWGKLSKGVLLQQDNPRVHTCKVAMDAVERNGDELIPHPAYSPDLALSTFFLFPNLKKDIRGLNFQSDEEVVNFDFFMKILSPWPWPQGHPRVGLVLLKNLRPISTIMPNMNKIHQRVFKIWGLINFNAKTSTLRQK